MNRLATCWIVPSLILVALTLLAGALGGPEDLAPTIALAESSSAAPTPAPAAMVSINTATLSPVIQRLPAPVWELGVPVQPPQNDKAAVTSASPQTPSGDELILREGFEGTFPSNGWALLDAKNDGKEYLWKDVNAKSHNDVWSAWPAAGGANGVDPSRNQYPNNVDSWMVYGPFDLSNASSAQATFWLWRSLKAKDSLYYGVSVDGVNFYGYYWDGKADWTWIWDDLSAYLGDDTVWVGWNFQSDGSGRDVGAFVDEILVTKNVQSCFAVANAYNCTVTALTGWDQMPFTLQQGEQFTIAYNTGAWTVDYRQSWPWVGPEGFTPDIDNQFDGRCKVDGASPYAKLLGQIGDGSLFQVGNGGTFTANADGALALRINDQDECLDDNDGAITLTMQKVVDLEVANIDITAPPICAGSTAEFTALVHNNSSIASDAFDIRWNADGQLFDGRHNSVAAGAVDTHGHIWMNISQGQHALTFIVDPNDQIVESNKANNYHTINFIAIDCSVPRLSSADKSGGLGAGVTVPVNYQANGNPISSLLFSVNYDETQLSFDPNLPNAIQFSPGLPASFIKQMVSFDPNDNNGELDFVFADFAQNSQALPSGELMSITFNVSPNATVGAQAPLQLEQTSFGSPTSEVTGLVINSTITIQYPDAIFLPVIRK